jgi:hypothetical protein
MFWGKKFVINLLALLGTKFSASAGTSFNVLIRCIGLQQAAACAYKSKSMAFENLGGGIGVRFDASLRATIRPSSGPSHFVFSIINDFSVR